VQAEPVAPAPAAQPNPAPNPAPKAEPKPAAAPESEGASLLDQLKAFWYVPVGLVALLGLLLGMRAVRRRREASTSDGFAPFAVEPTLARERDTTADTLPLRKSAEPRDTSIVVEENTLPRAAATVRKEAPRTIELDEAPADKPSVDSTGTFEQGDPLAEADFHMAYGLYDQAADLVKLAIAREPSRRDLKLKLLEVYFVWGNKEQFLQTARELAETREAAQPGEWEKVVIMGKQLAPEDPLFTQASGGVGASSVDLNLEGGQNLVDFDLPGEPSGRLPQLGDGMQADGGLSGLDFVLDDPARGADADPGATQATQQLQAPTYSIDGPTVEQPFNFDGPTVEQPALGIDDTLAGKLGARRAPVGGTDQTAELALDDLGLDLGKLEVTGTNLLDDSQLAPLLGSGDATGSSEQVSETLVAGLDDTARQLLQQAGNTEVTELMPMSELGTGDTSRVSGLDLNFDLGNEIDGNSATGKRVAPDFSLDLDIGDAEPASDGEYTQTQRIEPAAVVDADATQRDLEPVSMSEVGTKLDLARAYMDMGDPDGARSILGEVLAEGSAAQRQEAQRLLDSIPG
jgi:pilus assembly protein FimV